jgi:pimeloyl-ACP methyl ester carboxylesterase
VLSVFLAMTTLVLLAGCATNARRYNSLDLALLPCEEGALSDSFSGEAPHFFRAVEFDESGKPAFADQISDLRHRLQINPPVTDLIFFVHGWNKNPSSAESDYQDFLCRLHAHLPVGIGNEKRAGGLVVVGIFWPSTVTNEDHDPLAIKPLSYYRMRDRSDHIAQTGFADLLVDLTSLMARTRPRLQLIGHSFGGRMLVRAAEALKHDKTEDKLVPLLQAAGSVDVVLLNAAIPPERFEWLSGEVTATKAEGTPARSTNETRSFMFNVHSLNDTANRVLFRIASMFSDDPTTCAAGACGVPAFPTLCVDESGKIRTTPPDIGIATAFNAWNVDATRIIFDHSDIYKGRVAALVSTLIFDSKQKAAFRSQTSSPDTGTRCAWIDEH